jgi:hypothetical protein
MKRKGEVKGGGGQGEEGVEGGWPARQLGS